MGQEPKEKRNNNDDMREWKLKGARSVRLMIKGGKDRKKREDRREKGEDRRRESE